MGTKPLTSIHLSVLGHSRVLLYLYVSSNFSSLRQWELISNSKRVYLYFLLEFRVFSRRYCILKLMLFYDNDSGSFVDLRHYFLGILIKFPRDFLGRKTYQSVEHSFKRFIIHRREFKQHHLCVCVCVCVCVIMGCSYIALGTIR